MIILALDPAIKTGFAIGEPGDTPRLGTCKFKTDETDTLVDIFKHARFWMDNVLRTNDVDHLVIEGMVYTFGDTHQKTTDISRGLHGIFTSSPGVAVTIAPIATWRKYVLGRGNLKGPEAKRAMVKWCKHEGWNAPDHNAAEAAGLWLYGCAVLDPIRAKRVEPLFVGVS